ncbi:MAG: hypothetical protein J6I64_08930, partial [Lachnospiraceae bacterium]|nr:hypothetical protein [Lachnospiraceae bacterium]
MGGQVNGSDRIPHEKKEALICKVKFHPLYISPWKLPLQTIQWMLILQIFWYSYLVMLVDQGGYH